MPGRAGLFTYRLAALPSREKAPKTVLLGGFAGFPVRRMKGKARFGPALPPPPG